MQLPNDKSVIIGKFLVIFKVGYFLLYITYINQNCEIIAPYLLY